MSTPYGLAIVIALLLAIACSAMLTGCASQGVETKVCQLRYLGRTDGGDMMVFAACEFPEAYAAEQR